VSEVDVCRYRARLFALLPLSSCAPREVKGKTSPSEFSVSLRETGEREPGSKGGGSSTGGGRREREKWDFLVGGNRSQRIRQAASSDSSVFPSHGLVLDHFPCL
jgi:hypothetical protein